MSTAYVQEELICILHPVQLQRIVDVIRSGVVEGRWPLHVRVATADIRRRQLLGLGGVVVEIGWPRLNGRCAMSTVLDETA